MLTAPVLVRYAAEATGVPLASLWLHPETTSAATVTTAPTRMLLTVWTRAHSWRIVLGATKSKRRSCPDGYTSRSLHSRTSKLGDLVNAGRYSASLTHCSSLFRTIEDNFGLLPVVDRDANATAVPEEVWRNLREEQR